jgi:hypothetical protein
MNAPGTVEWWRVRDALHKAVDLVVDAFEVKKPTPPPTAWPAPKSVK